MLVLLTVSRGTCKTAGSLGLTPGRSGPRIILERPWNHLVISPSSNLFRLACDRLFRRSKDTRPPPNPRLKVLSMSRLPSSGMRSSAGQNRVPSRSTGGGGAGFRVVECPNMQLAFSNCLIVSNEDLGSSPYVTVKGRYVFTTRYAN